MREKFTRYHDSGDENDYVQSPLFESEVKKDKRYYVYCETEGRLITKDRPEKIAEIYAKDHMSVLNHTVFIAPMPYHEESTDPVHNS